ncbi:MAG: DUF1697 domain-containing protein [Bauldia sp.]|nr:DUF1697 domain-containing protein [Bauldia sp.]
MPSHVALLRAVNVGGTGMVAMAALRDLFADLGFGAAKTLLQSGNVVFDGGRTAPAKLEATLEAEALSRLGLRTDFIIRTAAEWSGVVAANPFPDFARDNPKFLHVGFAKSAPDKAAIAAVEEAIAGLPEQVKMNGRESYIVYPGGAGTSKLGPALVKVERKHPSIRATARNWNTVMKIAALLDG